MPDLAFDMATSFNTNVNIYLHDAEGEEIVSYKGPKGYVNAERIKELGSKWNGAEKYSGMAELGLLGDKDDFKYFYSYGDYTNTPGFEDLVIEIGETEDGKKLFVPINSIPSDYIRHTDPEDEAFTSFADLETIQNMTEGWSQQDIDDLEGNIGPTWFDVEGINNYYREHPDDKNIYTEDDEKIKKNYVLDDEQKELADDIIDKVPEIDDNYKTYMPYIASVTDHWYRNVYFVLDDDVSNFIKMDYEYEKAMRERWTLYETNDDDTYTLYRINDDGTMGELYEGTQEEANAEEIKVTKKARVLDNLEEELEDLSWNNDNGIWMAYNPEAGAGNTDYVPAYEDTDDDVEKNYYTRIKFKSGIIKQEGEAQRTETNPKIKKMFSTNKYYRYEGDRHTAEIITELRKSVLGEHNYGPMVDKSENIDYSDTSKVIDGETCKVDDYISNVSLNQDSLTAFSMLENTHTLDADYIYRDFKELIVELGYFTKEELTDETPRLLEFLVPSVGSYGYPYRPLDKNENEYGTMIHSNGDMSVMNYLEYEKFLEGLDNSTVGEEENHNQNDGVGPHVTSTGSTNSEDLAGEPTEAREPTDVTVDEFLEAAEKIHSVLEEDEFEYCQGTEGSHNADNPHTRHGSGHARYNTLNEARPQNGGLGRVDCSAYVSWVLQEVGLLDHVTWTGPGEGSLYDIFAEYVIPREEAGELQPGDIAISAEHTQIMGYDNTEYNGGSSGVRVTPTPNSWSWNGYTDVIRMFDNTKKEDEDDKKEITYLGYEGNEAVVSPVTGILLEYGQYDGSQKDSISDEEYRTNVDLKYNVEGEKRKQIDKYAGEANEETTQNAPYDKVGYAKIFVLDKSTYMQMPGALGYGINENGKFIDIFEGMDADQIEEYLKEMDNTGDNTKTLYGYKEFLEAYEYAGIAGHIVYIDGFVCEYPEQREETEGEEGELTSGETGADNNAFTPSGEPITIDTFTGLSGVAPDETNSEYKADEEHKLASKKETEKLKAEIAIKDEAAVAFYTGGNVKVRLTDPEKEGKDEGKEVEYPGIFIKEGTVIGRTMTDYELLNNGIRVGETMSYEEARPEEKDENNIGHVIGNYLRIIMLENTSRDEIENAEDYMKLDVPNKSKKNMTEQEYQAWPEDLELLAEGIHHEAGYDYLAALSQKFASDQTEADFEMYCMGYSIVNKLLEQNKPWYGHLYDENNTEMSPLAQVLTSPWYGIRNIMQEYIAGTHGGCFTDKELEYAEYCLEYDCTTIEKPYETPLGAAAAGDGYTATPAGTVIPRCMCQQGGYGDGAPGQSGIILVGFWDHDNTGDFGVGDELWGVDRIMEHLID